MGKRTTSAKHPATMNKQSVWKLYRFDSGSWQMVTKGDFSHCHFYPRTDGTTYKVIPYKERP